MNVIGISDLHGQLYPPDQLECDLLLIAGDICPLHEHSITGYAMQSIWLDEKFRPWLKEVPAKYIVAICGNHDVVFEKFPKEVPSDLPWHYLQDNSITIKGLKIYGTPYTNWFLDWAFNLDKDDPNETKLRLCFEQIPNDTDILMTHGPPHGILDQIAGVGDHLGSVALRERVFKVKPRLHVHGHIHSAINPTDLSYPDPKVMEIKIDDGDEKITFANVSVLDEDYKIAYKPFRMEL